MWSRLQESWARLKFEKFSVPLLGPGGNERLPSLDQFDTAVTPEQAMILVSGIASTEHLVEPVVEVGSFRGVTTRLLASRTARKFIAVDPFRGYGGAAADLRLFEERISSLPNVIHLRESSGEAARRLRGDCFSFVFIDAVHDYVNTRFDSIAWGSLLRKDGLIAFHDTDNRAFAGTRRAVFELHAGGQFELQNHVHDLVVLRKLA
jgi:predicted O-methyltransferase YrrM